jgi:hypothetical protein
MPHFSINGSALSAPNIFTAKIKKLIDRLNKSKYQKRVKCKGKSEVFSHELSQPLSMKINLD